MNCMRLLLNSTLSVPLTPAVNAATPIARIAENQMGCRRQWLPAALRSPGK
jgi:hypothetical protein